MRRTDTTISERKRKQLEAQRAYYKRKLESPEFREERRIKDGIRRAEKRRKAKEAQGGLPEEL